MRIVGVGDVRVRQPFDADLQPVVGGAIAQCGESGYGFVERALVRADRLQVACADAIGQLVRERLHEFAISVRVAAGGPPALDRLDLAEDEAIGAQDVGDVAQRTVLFVTKAPVLKSVESDGAESGGRSRGDSLVELPEAGSAEV